MLGKRLKEPGSNDQWRAFRTNNQGSRSRRQSDAKLLPRIILLIWSVHTEFLLRLLVEVSGSSQRLSPITYHYLPPYFCALRELLGFWVRGCHLYTFAPRCACSNESEQFCFSLFLPFLPAFLSMVYALLVSCVLYYLSSRLQTFFPRFPFSLPHIDPSFLVSYFL